jgi:hypothetical protein
VAEGELAEGQHLVRGLRASPGTVAVWGADPSREAPGWRLHGVDLGMRDGRPFGSISFEVIDGSHRAQVAVRWDHVYDQLQCFVTDRAITGPRREALERDARHRVGALMAAYAQVGLSIAFGAAVEGALRAAANLIPADTARSS